MKNLKTIIVSIVALVLGVGGTGAVLGFSGNESAVKFNVYGSETGTTAVTSTIKTAYVGSANSTLNLNIKTTSTGAQTIAIVPEFSNDAEDCSTATYFRQSLVGISGGAATVATSTYTIQVPKGAYTQAFQIPDLNTECLKLTLTSSAVASTSMLWVEAAVK